MEKVVQKKTIKRKKNTQGAKANYSGQRFEDKCEELFKRENFIIMSYQKYVSLHDKPKRALVKNCPYKNGKGGIGRTEFVAIDGDRAIRIEAKYQASQGSVEEKLWWTLHEAFTSYPEKEAVLVVEGEGYHPQFKKVLVQEAKRRNKLKRTKVHVDVLNYLEFARFVDANFKKQTPVK